MNDIAGSEFPFLEAACAEQPEFLMLSPEEVKWLADLRAVARDIAVEIAPIADYGVRQAHIASSVSRAVKAYGKHIELREQVAAYLRGHVRRAMH